MQLLLFMTSLFLSLLMSSDVKFQFLGCVSAFIAVSWKKKANADFNIIYLDIT